jgi:hypothetical protein
MMTSEQREAIKARLAEIENANGGRLTPDMVVKDAKRKDSPLHACFTWDVKAAAAAYWVQQARDLITSVRVVVKTETTSVSSVYYVRDPAARSDQQGYVSVQTLRTDVELAREALVGEFSRVADMLRRAREIAVVLDAQQDIETLLQGVVGLRQRFIDQQPVAQ